MTIAIGAGVSASAGFPAWTELLNRIVSTYFCHWEFQRDQRSTSSKRPPSNLSIAFWESMFWSAEAQQNAKDLIDAYGPLRAAQIVKQHLRPADWVYLVRKSLYGHHGSRESDLVSAISEVCVANPAVDVLSYNYDNLIEGALNALGRPVNPIYDSGCSVKPSRTNIAHPHGYLDEHGGPSTELILGEHDYHRYASQQAGWHNMVQARAFLRSTCLFVGLSMSDPQMCRLLWQAKQSSTSKHYAILPSSVEAAGRRPELEMLADSYLLSLNVVVIRYFAGHDQRDHSRVPALIRQIARGLQDPTTIWD